LFLATIGVHRSVLLVSKEVRIWLPLLLAIVRFKMVHVSSSLSVGVWIRKVDITFLSVIGMTEPESGKCIKSEWRPSQIGTAHRPLGVHSSKAGLDSID
jgi:hypothetical protein